jgi:hypothetical protein
MRTLTVTLVACVVAQAFAYTTRTRWTPLREHTPTLSHDRIVGGTSTDDISGGGGGRDAVERWQTRASSLLLACTVAASPFLGGSGGGGVEWQDQQQQQQQQQLPPVAWTVERRRRPEGGVLFSFGGAAHAATSDLKERLDEYGRQYSAVRRQELKNNAESSGSGGGGGGAAATRVPSERERWIAELERDRSVIKVLYAYLEEIERDIFARKWDTLLDYIDVFSRQEAAFVALIENSFPGPSDANKQASALMRYEAQQMFLQLDDMAEAARFRDVNKAEKAYVGLAIAYDRFLKAGDLYDVYDDTDTSKIYEMVRVWGRKGGGGGVNGRVK